ncbi:hypothetical protein GCM10010140_34050 [Streptosporangium pseudovulgare]|uniref:Uncharacterized protein n=1 Tax=Streptosporangium pseudovulgare TaxID=35765 RepID=A0ABQ2QZL8_9ACTN|nr:hypothetical protein GCM10010140_34050 [Streptosporangium pseudovulgare]
MVSPDTCIPRSAYETEAGDSPVAFATSRIVARFRGWGTSPGYVAVRRGRRLPRGIPAFHRVAGTGRAR